MPEAAAPTAPARQPTIVEGGTPPLRSPGGVIRASDIAALPGEKAPPSTTSRQSFTKRLETFAKPVGEPTTTPTPIKEPPKEEIVPPKEEKVAENEPTVPENGENVPRGTKTAADDIDPKTGKPKKANPWKLYDSEKKARAAAEAEVQRLKTSVVPEQERTVIMARVEKAEARSKELEDHIRFVSYEKSAEFRDQYQAPYEAAWKRATTELSEIGIVDPITQQQRAVTSQDIFELVNMPLGKAREVADEVFGRFADDVMAHRKEIRGLFEKQNQALEEARKNGGARDQQNREAWQKRTSETSQFVKTAWEEAEKEAVNDAGSGVYFKPKTVEEGQQLTPEETEWNEAFERGEKFVKKAMSVNVMNPKLTPEERRAAIIELKAVEKRAIAFGPLKRLTRRLEAKIAKLEKDLAEYSGSTPSAGGSTPQNGVKTASSARQSFSERLKKIAH